MSKELAQAILAAMIEVDRKPEKKDPLPEVEVQITAIEKFINMPKLTVGQRVQRRKHGTMNRYGLPKFGQVALVSKVFETPMLDEEGKLVDGEISVFNKREDYYGVVSYLVDLRHYEAYAEPEASDEGGETAKA